jgi:hypothetical protein
VLSRNQGFEVSGFLIQFEVSMNLGFRFEVSRDKVSGFRNPETLSLETFWFRDLWELKLQGFENVRLLGFR